MKPPKRYPFFQPADQVCPECGKPCMIVGFDDSFNYTVPNGEATHYPGDCGSPVSDCCNAFIPDAEYDTP